MSRFNVSINMENSKIIKGVIEGHPTSKDAEKVIKQVFGEIVETKVEE